MVGMSDLGSVQVMASLCTSYMVLPTDACEDNPTMHTTIVEVAVADPEEGPWGPLTPPPFEVNFIRISYRFTDVYDSHTLLSS